MSGTVVVALRVLITSCISEETQPQRHIYDTLSSVDKNIINPYFRLCSCIAKKQLRS